MAMGEQRLGQLSQESFEEGGDIVGMEVTGGKVNISSAVELLSEDLLSQAVPGNPKETLNMQICRQINKQGVLGMEVGT